MGSCCVEAEPGCSGACCRGGPLREGPGCEGAAPPGCWDPVGNPEEGGWEGDPGQKGILVCSAWGRPKVASCCREDSGCNQGCRGCCPWVGHGNPPTNCGGNQGPPQGVLDPCGVYEGPHWVAGAVTVEAAEGWAVTVTVAAERGWVVTVRGGTTVAAGHKVAATPPASLNGEAGRVAVALV